MRHKGLQMEHLLPTPGHVTREILFAPVLSANNELSAPVKNPLEAQADPRDHVHSYSAGVTRDRVYRPATEVGEPGEWQLHPSVVVSTYKVLTHPPLLLRSC